MPRMTVDEIVSAIDAGFFTVDALRLQAHCANEIKHIKDADTRDALTLRFEARAGRNVTVWARIERRFPQVFDNSIPISADGIIAVARMCQLPEKISLELFARYAALLDQPLVYQLLDNEIEQLKPRRAARAKPAPQPCAICTRVREVLERYEQLLANVVDSSDGQTDVSELQQWITDLSAALDGAGEGAE